MSWTVLINLLLNPVQKPLVPHERGSGGFRYIKADRVLEKRTAQAHGVELIGNGLVAAYIRSSRKA